MGGKKRKKITDSVKRRKLPPIPPDMDRAIEAYQEANDHRTWEQAVLALLAEALNSHGYDVHPPRSVFGAALKKDDD